MESLIFGGVSLVMLAIFFALSAMPAYVAYWIGSKTSIYLLRWALPVLVIAVPCTWAATSYLVFKRDCETVQKPLFLSSPIDKPDGIFVEGPHLGGKELIESGAFNFIEQPHDNDTIRRDFANRAEWVSLSSSKTEFVAKELPPELVEYWWAPPIYRYEIHVTEKSSGRLLAKATDLVFGGGLLSWYMSLIGGDQDFRRLSCGYISADIGPWRPTLASRPYFGYYLRADSDFLVKALSPNKQRK
jgi:hypothetical protein